MISQILEAITTFLKTIPIVADWFKKHEIEKERKQREKIDKEHEEIKETGRPSNEFWDERHL